MKTPDPPTAQSLLISTAPQIELEGRAPALTFDAEKYLKFIAASGWSDDQKIAYLTDYWKMWVIFADLAFRGYPLPPLFEISTLEVDSPPMLDSDLSSQNIELENAVCEAQVGERLDS